MLRSKETVSSRADHTNWISVKAYIQVTVRITYVIFKKGGIDLQNSNGRGKFIGVFGGRKGKVKWCNYNIKKSCKCILKWAEQRQQETCSSGRGNYKASDLQATKKADSGKQSSSGKNTSTAYLITNGQCWKQAYK